MCTLATIKIGTITKVQGITNETRLIHTASSDDSALCSIVVHTPHRLWCLTDVLTFQLLRSCCANPNDSCIQGQCAHKAYNILRLPTCWDPLLIEVFASRFNHSKICQTEMSEEMKQTRFSEENKSRSVRLNYLFSSLRIFLASPLNHHLII